MQNVQYNQSGDIGRDIKIEGICECREGSNGAKIKETFGE